MIGDERCKNGGGRSESRDGEPYTRDKVVNMEGRWERPIRVRGAKKIITQPKTKKMASRLYKFKDQHVWSKA